jgi:hypothetical protein
MLVLVMDEIRRDVENEIRTAFRGVTLGQGISIRKAQLSDRSRIPPGTRIPALPRVEKLLTIGLGCLWTNWKASP